MNYTKENTEWYIDISFINELEKIEDKYYNVTEYKDFNISTGDYFFLLKGVNWVMTSSTRLSVKTGKNTIYITRNEDGLSVRIN